MKNIAKNSLRAWILAARPKTLSGALVSVVTAVALFVRLSGGIGGMGRGEVQVALLCAGFAVLMQVASNFINDWYDFIRGNDREDRLGPKRACQQGWISPEAMKKGILLVVLLAGVVGLWLLFVVVRSISGAVWPTMFFLVGVGLLCVAGAFLYSSHLSSKGWGDVLVLLFFGLVPVCVTFFLLAQTLSSAALVLGFSVGLVVDTLLVVNNFRDRDTDRSVGKRTLVVLIGEKMGSRLYGGLGIVAVALIVLLDFMLHGSPTALSLLTLLYLPLHLSAWRKMRQIWSGRKLNEVLSLTARNILVYAFLVSSGMLF